MELFERIFEEEYDIKTDSQYSLWLEVYHHESGPQSASVVKSNCESSAIDDIQEFNLMMILSSSKQQITGTVSDHLTVPTLLGARN